MPGGKSFRTAPLPKTSSISKKSAAKKPAKKAAPSKARKAAKPAPKPAAGKRPLLANGGKKS